MLAPATGAACEEEEAEASGLSLPVSSFPSLSSPAFLFPSPNLVLTNFLVTARLEVRRGASLGITKGMDLLHELAVGARLRSLAQELRASDCTHGTPMWENLPGLGHCLGNVISLG